MSDISTEEQLQKDVGLVLKDFLKVIKVVSMYPEDNPLPQSLRQSFADRLVDLTDDCGEIKIQVEKDILLFKGKTVFRDKSREDRLAGIFFENGVRDFVFRRGLTCEEIQQLLNSIKSYLNKPEKSRDLAADLWEADLTGFFMSTVEDIVLSEYEGNFSVQEFIDNHDWAQTYSGQQEQQEQQETENYEAVFATHSHNTPSVETDHHGTLFDMDKNEAQEKRADEAVTAMGYTDLPSPPVNVALIISDEIKLSEEEQGQLQKTLYKDALFDPLESTTELLKEILNQEDTREGFSESVTICEKVITDYVRSGKLKAASNLFRYFKELEPRITADHPFWAERLREVFVTAGSRDRLTILGKALNNHVEVESEDLEQYLENFDWKALGGMSDLLGVFDHRHHREALCDFLAWKGERNPEFLTKSLYDRQWYVVRNAVMILTRIGNDHSLEHLKNVVAHPERRVRLELVAGLAKSDSTKALALLRQAVGDHDSEIRRQAVDSIVARRGQDAFDTIADIIDDNVFSSSDSDDQRALLRAYSILGGDQAVSYLTHLITRMNPLRRDTLSFQRRAAFEALSYNASEKAEQMLIKLSSNLRPSIKRQSTMALNIRRDRLQKEK